MCDPFNITISTNPEDLLTKATAKLELQGGTLTGDIKSGKLNITLPFVGLIEGVYAITDNVITITVTGKPALLPCGIIETKIREFLAS